METHFATLWENISDVIPDRKALICGNIERTWKEYDDRALSSYSFQVLSIFPQISAFLSGITSEMFSHKVAKCVSIFIPLNYFILASSFHGLRKVSFGECIFLPRVEIQSLWSSKDFESPPVAEIYTPQRIPFGAHGSWMPK